MRLDGGRGVDRMGERVEERWGKVVGEFNGRRVGEKEEVWIGGDRLSRVEKVESEMVRGNVEEVGEVGV